MPKPSYRHFPLILSSITATLTIALILSCLVLSIPVLPHIHLSILISATLFLWTCVGYMSSIKIIWICIRHVVLSVCVVHIILNDLQWSSTYIWHVLTFSSLCEGGIAWFSICCLFLLNMLSWCDLIWGSLFINYVKKLCPD